MGCNICNIVCESSSKWHIINSNGEIIESHQLNDNTMKDIIRTIESYKVSNNLD